MNAEVSIACAVTGAGDTTRASELQVDVAGDLRDAIVVQMPFIDPKKETAEQPLAGRI